MPHWRNPFGRDKVVIPNSVAVPDLDVAERAEPVVEDHHEDPALPLPIKGRTPSNRIATKKHTHKLVRQYYKRYQLKWPKLREWLENTFPQDKYPDVEFTKTFDATKEYYAFNVPRQLTKDEFAEIDKLRNDAD